MLADTFIWPHVQMLRSLKASIFPFDSTKSAISPPSEWLAPPFSGFLAIWACTELDAAELHLPSKYVEQGKYWAQRNFHPVKEEISTYSSRINFSIYIMEYCLNVSNISLVPKFITFLAIKFQKVKSILSWSGSQKNWSENREFEKTDAYLDSQRFKSAFFLLTKDTAHNMAKETDKLERRERDTDREDEKSRQAHSSLADRREKQKRWPIDQTSLNS